MVSFLYSNADLVTYHPIFCISISICSSLPANTTNKHRKLVINYVPIPGDKAAAADGYYLPNYPCQLHLLNCETIAGTGLIACPKSIMIFYSLYESTAAPPSPDLNLGMYSTTDGGTDRGHLLLLLLISMHILNGTTYKVLPCLCQPLLLSVGEE